MLRLFLLSLCLVASLGSPITPRKEIAGKAVDTAKYRLPATTAPISYVLELRAILDSGNATTAFTFTGDVLIKIKVNQPTQSIVLHKRNITVPSASISVYEVTTPPSVVDLYSNSAEVTDDTEFFTINLNSLLNVSKTYQISIKNFNGVIQAGTSGFYRSSYVTPHGERRWLATTQFESTGARMAFPCYDEPALKATFKITLVHDGKLTAISNSPELPVKYNNATGLTESPFEETPIMSTYLLAFVISDFDFVKATPANPRKPQRVYAQPEYISRGQGNYSLATGVKTLNELEDYFQGRHPFHISKMDQIAIPDFAAGAMENWGLVTYRINYLMVVPNVTTTRTMQSIACVIAHEYAHQWFGNNVSPSWWNFIWLNEGFATYFEHFTTDKVETTWKLAEQFSVEVLQNAFKSDSRASTRAMTSDAGSPNEISALFDTIAYDKSGAVIRMMEHIVTPAKFRAGLIAYQTNRDKEAASDTDLYSAMQDQSPANLPSSATLTSVMQSWSNQAGYPLITVTRDYANDKLSITQKRYYEAGDSAGNLLTKWWIPVNWARENGSFQTTTPMNWVDPSKDSLDLTDIKDKDSFIIFNIQQTGYYRVNYDKENWNLIRKYMENGASVTAINVQNRAQLIDDALNLAKSGDLDYDVALHVIGFLAHEIEYIPWKAADNALIGLNQIFGGSEEYTRFKNFVGDMAKKLYSTLTINESDGEHVDRYSRAIAVKWACLANVLDCREKAAAILSSHLTSNTTIPVDLKAVLYCAALHGADKALWNGVVDKYTTVATADKLTLINALGCAEDKNIRKEYLQQYYNGTSVLLPHRSYILSSVYTPGGDGVDVTLEFLHESMEKVLEVSPASLSSIMSGLGGRITTAKQLESLTSLHTHYKTQIDAIDTTGSIMSTAKAVAATNIKWLEGREPSINAWLQQNIRGSSATTASLNAVLLIASGFLVYCTRN